jgi:hypothetical protein
MLWGVALIVVSLVEYNVQAEMQKGLWVSGFESGLNAPPVHQRMVHGSMTGLLAVGLSIALFYLCRLYLSRRQ